MLGDDREVGVEQRVDKDDEQRTVYIGLRQLDRARGSVLDLLLDKDRRDVVAGSYVSLDLLLEVARDEDQAFDVEPLQHVLDDVVQDGLARYPE